MDRFDPFPLVKSYSTVSATRMPCIHAIYRGHAGVLTGGLAGGTRPGRLHARLPCRLPGHIPRRLRRAFGCHQAVYRVCAGHCGQVPARRVPLASAAQMGATGLAQKGNGRPGRGRTRTGPPHPERGRTPRQGPDTGGAGVAGQPSQHAQRPGPWRSTCIIRGNALYRVSRPRLARLLGRITRVARWSVHPGFLW